METFYDSLKTFAEFDLTKTSQNYHIYSKNDLGTSENFSIVKIPRQSQKKVQVFGMKTLISNATLFNFSWALSEEKDVRVFVVYCVIEVSDSPTFPFKCSHSFKYVEVTSKNHFQINDNRPLAFGVTTLTSDNFTSGITWSDCTVNIDTITHSKFEKLGKINQFYMLFFIFIYFRNWISKKYVDFKYWNKQL